MNLTNFKPNYDIGFYWMSCAENGVSL